MNTPKVTMIIISYNEMEYLPRAIESCLMQDYENKEIIIGDDGSNDGSIELIKSFQDRGIRYFVMDRNEERSKIIPSLRVSNVIKRAIDLTDGDYYVILSGDDYYLRDQMLSKAVAYLESHKDHFAYVYGFQKASDKEVLETFVPRALTPAVYYSGAYVHVSCFVFRRLDSKELLNRFCDDTGLEFVLATKGKWKYDKTIAFSYFQREKSIMHEADQTELAVIEIMVMQDIFNWNGKRSAKINFAIQSRYYKPYRYLCQHPSFEEEKYKKYLSNSSNFSSNFFETIKRKPSIPVRMTICHFLGRIARKLCL